MALAVSEKTAAATTEEELVAAAEEEPAAVVEELGTGRTQNGNYQVFTWKNTWLHVKQLNELHTKSMDYIKQVQIGPGASDTG